MASGRCRTGRRPCFRVRSPPRPLTTTVPIVVATTSIWADIVDRVDCADQFTVETLIPVGGDAHSFEPSMRDRQRLGDAALVVANGGGLEAQLEDTLDAVAGEGVTVLSLFDHVDAGEDPHLWFDPTVVADAAAVIAGELVAAGADERHRASSASTSSSPSWRSSTPR